MKKRYYSYSDFEKDVKKLHSELKHRSFKNIYAMPRGGYMLGVRLSHLLGIPMVDRPRCIGKDTLIVDDIVDSGKTLNTYRHYSIVVLHYKPKTACFEPRFYAHTTSEYIVYAWERGGIPLEGERSEKILNDANI